jgi:NTE family protein
MDDLPRLLPDHRQTEHYDRIALAFQGGGALGAYQAGVYEALAESDYEPDWITGVSIGAINAAIIAGNPPERRVERLRQWWDQVASQFSVTLPPATGPLRTLHNQFTAATTVAFGVPGFFRPRLPPPWLRRPGDRDSLSLYDTAPLRKTLESLIDFDLVNSGRVRLAVGAVHVASGNSVYFDSLMHEIRPEHIMASGALPPSFPGVEIDGELYWDGGVLSNAPLAYIMGDPIQPASTLLFEVDLFSAGGLLPKTLDEVQERQKDITYSSRTRFITDSYRQLCDLRFAVSELLDRLPEELRDSPDLARFQALASPHVYNIVHLIYRRKIYDGNSKDYEFSRPSIRERWQAGYDDTRRTLRHPEWLKTPPPDVGVVVHDLREETE